VTVVVPTGKVAGTGSVEVVGDVEVCTATEVVVESTCAAVESVALPAVRPSFATISPVNASVSWFS
jgi:hypothetical protein